MKPVGEVSMSKNGEKPGSFSEMKRCLILHWEVTQR